MAVAVIRELRVVPRADDGADADLLSRIAKGDLGALGELYDRHAVAVLRFTRRFAPHEDAEDATQVVFLRAVGAAARFRAGTKARPWLFGIALRVLRERRRSLARWAAALADLGRQPARVVPAPDGLERDVARALASLSEADRACILLAELEGLTGSEIAEILGVPVGTVWRRLHDARRRLKRVFEEKT